MNDRSDFGTILVGESVFTTLVLRCRPDWPFSKIECFPSSPIYS